jgi:hypothetical protein
MVIIASPQWSLYIDGLIYTAAEKFQETIPPERAIKGNWRQYFHKKISAAVEKKERDIYIKTKPLSIIRRISLWLFNLHLLCPTMK